MREFAIITSSLPGSAEPSLAIAGSRAGATGLLDLEYASDIVEIRENLQRLEKYGGKRLAVKLGGRVHDLFRRILSELPPRVRLIVLCFAGQDQLKPALNLLRTRDVEVLLECTSFREARSGEEIGVDGLIAKGHEAGGRIGDETTFILLQKLVGAFDLPVWAHGGIGLHSAAACCAAGARGVVLDTQLALARESPLDDAVKRRLSAMDGSETLCIGEEGGPCYRVCSHFGRPVIEELQRLSATGNPIPFEEAVGKHAGVESEKNRLIVMGQDIAFAGPLARKYTTTGAIVQAFQDAVDEHIDTAQRLHPLQEHSPMAQSHGTRYPIVQGPMARVSDTPGFCARVALEGALPFVAAAWMRGPEFEEILSETKKQCQGLPWGVGLMGFLPREIYREQLNTVFSVRPPFALIAGAQPGQAGTLERDGIPTYVHIPSQGLLRMFLEEGVRRFVFEGRESGGHVGPLSSFVLWDSLITLLQESGASGNPPKGCHVLFAGGIRDAVSAAMIGVMASPLADMGIRVGLQLGTAYLFTEEAVATRAISGVYQEEAIKSRSTILLETGVGHAVRCLDTPFAGRFKRERGLLLKNGAAADEISEALEKLKQGRLRIASKGLNVNPEHRENPRAPRLVPVSEEEQFEQGLYMVGQLASLQDKRLPMSELHRDLVIKGSERVQSLKEDHQRASSGDTGPGPLDIAVVGMACLLPKSPDLASYWENILNKVSAIGEVPIERWDWRLYYDKDRHARDKIYSKWGAFLGDIPFDPVAHGMPPNSLPSIEPLHLLFLDVVGRALEDAGCLHKPFPRETTSVVLGVSGSGEKGQLYSCRTLLPMFLGDSAREITSRFGDHLSEWTEDSFPGILMNVAAGRIANRFNLGGMNCSIDGACASSLAALYTGVRELEARTSDVVIVGGADCMQNPFTYMCFSKTQALSPTGESRPLDENADGIVLGEGVTAVILKRLSDAERDGDRIYAVIKGIGASSDGRDKSLTAPGIQGQIRAIDRAYARAGYSPAQVQLIEAHATGTPVGDRTEVDVLTRVFKDAGADKAACAIGSVKSMIGHTKSAAGLASLIKAVLALYHRVLPPTLGVERPNPGLRVPDSPFYVNTEPRPWFGSAMTGQRAAGVSAFGFGGTNFHVTLEAYEGDFLDHLRQPCFKDWPSELFCWHEDSRQDLVKALWAVEEALENGAEPRLAELAYGCARASELHRTRTKERGMNLSVVASSLKDLKEKLGLARKRLIASEAEIHDPRGIYFTDRPLSSQGKTAFVFPGQGSQYVHMMGDLAMLFPEVLACFEKSDHILRDKIPRSLSSYIFPPAAFTEEERLDQAQSLSHTTIAQTAMGTADLAVYSILNSLGIRADMVAGHSYGEYVALCAAGVFGEDDLIRISEARARFILEGATVETGSMAAINAGHDVIEKCLEGMKGVWVSNVNAPLQTVIAGKDASIDSALKDFKGRGIQVKRIPTSCAFHSPIVEPACEKLEAFLAGIPFHSPTLQVFSNTTALPHPKDPDSIKTELVRHLIGRVEFVRQIRNMYKHGARVFIEAGPGRVLTGLVDQILEGRSHLALASHQAGRSGPDQLLHLIAQLSAHGLAVDTERIYRGRGRDDTSLSALLSTEDPIESSPTAWMVNGARARSPRDAGKREEPVIPLKYDAAPSGEQAQRSPNEQETSETRLRMEGDIDQVMERHQKLMRRFLETQQNVMTRYLTGLSHEKVVGLQGPEDSSNPERENPEQALAREVPAVPEDRLEAVRESLAGKEKNGSPQVEGQGAASRPAPGPDEPLDLDPERLTPLLLEIVSDRTGYPVEMLDMEIDLEAGFGIDSIKRVEILGRFIKAVFKKEDGGPPEALEILNGVKTLGQIVARVSSLQPLEYESPGKPEDVPVTEKESLLPRFTTRPVEVPHEAGEVSFPANHCLLITDDGRGIAKALVQRLGREGIRTAVLQWKGGGDVFGSGHYILKNGSEESMREVLEEVKAQQGPIGGLVHLYPLAEVSPDKHPSPGGLPLEIHSTIKTLFHLAKALENDLRQPPGDGRALLMAATAIDPKEAFVPEHGAVPGFLKSMDMEWPDVRVKAVDVSLKEAAGDLADRLYTEMWLDDGFSEVRYDGPRRMIAGLSESPLEQRDDTLLSLDESWVILVTGGARGITARVAMELARRFTPRLILAGKSPLPPEKESYHTANLTRSQELKSALISEMKAEGKVFQLPDVEAAYRQLLKDREIRANLAAMKEAGSRVEYHQVDVRDDIQFGALIASIYETHGRIDGVVHGAGIIEDRLFSQKDWESFGRVFGTKTGSSLVLCRRLEPGTLKFLAFFSSVAGRFGNAGQSDYTAANNALNRLAEYLNDKWPARVFSVNWGPWAGGGMATEDIQRQFASRGVGMVSPEEGPRYFALELEKGRKDESELVIGQGPWKDLVQLHDPPDTAGTRGMPLPLLQHAAEITQESGGHLEITRRFDPREDLYLLDHRLEGKPVLPAAMAIEFMAEASQTAYPEWKVVAMRDVRVFKGVVLEEDPVRLSLAVQPKEDAGHGKGFKTLDVSVTNPLNRIQTFYKATAVLSKSLPFSRAGSPLSDMGLSPFRTSVKGAYEEWLFHGPRFQCIRDIQGISEKGMAARLVPSSPYNCLASPTHAHWLMDPVAIDGGLQLVLLWARNFLDITVLPSSFEVVHVYRPFHTVAEISCQLEIVEHARQTVCCNIYFMDQANRLLGKIERFEATGSRDLNRLTGLYASGREGIQ